MSTNTKLTIKSRSYADDKKTVSNTINYVNPNISNQTALQLAQRINALTLNSYKSTDKIETTELDSIIPKGARTFNSFTYTKTVDGTAQSIEVPADGIINITTSEIRNKQINFTIGMTFDGEAPEMEDVSSTSNANLAQISYAWLGYSSQINNWSIIFATHADYGQRQDITAGVISFNLHFDETDEFAAYNKSITVNITEG